jgi:hypothetical protein
LISSASSFETPSFSLPPLSAKSLASFNPRPVISLITLITAIFEAPAFVNSTSKLVFSSSPPAAAHPPAIITGAAAETPNSSSIAVTRSFNSTIVNSLTKSIICCAFFVNSAIFQKIIK